MIKQYFIIDEHEIVIADFGTNKDTLFLSNGDELEVYNQSLNGESYSWDFGDGNLKNGFELNHIYFESGSYEVSLITSGLGNTCSDTLVKTMVVLESPLSVGNKEDGNVTLINNESGVSLLLASNRTEDYIIHVYNSLGQEVFYDEIFSSQQRYELDIPMRGYFVISIEGDSFKKTFSLKK